MDWNALIEERLAALRELYNEFYQEWEQAEENFYTEILLKMAEDGEINEAENKLFALMEEETKNAYINVGCSFYSTLQRMNEEELEFCGFSREEIADGLKDIMVLYCLM